MYQDRRGYWYRSKRIGGRVVREYVGSGEVAALGAQLEAHDARCEAQQRAQAKAADAAIDEPMEAFCADVEKLAREALEAAGYHQHARGQWRKRREQKHSEAEAGSAHTADLSSSYRGA